MIDSDQLKADARKWGRVHGLDSAMGEALAGLAGSVAEQITVESIKRLDVQPGEILVATVPEDTDRETLDLVADNLRAKLPDSVKLIVVTNVEFHILSGAPTSG